MPLKAVDHNLFVPGGQLFLYFLYDNDLERLSIFTSMTTSLLYSYLKSLRFLSLLITLCLSNPSLFAWHFNYFCKYFPFKFCCNACVFYFCIFGNKIDLFKATHFILFFFSKNFLVVSNCISNLWVIPSSPLS
jgi:hypothetical protein